MEDDPKFSGPVWGGEIRPFFGVRSSKKKGKKNTCQPKHSDAAKKASRRHRFLALSPFQGVTLNIHIQKRCGGRDSGKRFAEGHRRYTTAA